MTESAKGLWKMIFICLFTLLLDAAGVFSIVFLILHGAAGGGAYLGIAVLLLVLVPWNYVVITALVQEIRKRKKERKE